MAKKGTGTASVGIAGTVAIGDRDSGAETAPRGWDSKEEYYGFVGGGYRRIAS